MTPDYAIHLLQKLYTLRKTYYGLPGTDDELLSNFIASLKSEHSIISIFFAPAASPYSKIERFIHVFIMWSWTFCLTSGFYRSSELAATIYITLIMFPISVAARYAMECPCFYNGNYNRNIKKRRECCVTLTKCFGALESITCCCFSFLLLVVGFTIGESKPKVFFIF